MGITTGPTTALIGVAGREAVLPLENNTGWMDTLADKLSSRMNNNESGRSNNNAQSQAPNITINIGGTKFGEIAANEINKAQRKAGRILLDL